MTNDTVQMRQYQKDEQAHSALRVGRYLHSHHYTKLKACYPAMTSDDFTMLAYIMRQRCAFDGDHIPLGALGYARYATGNPALEHSKNYAIQALVDHLQQSTGMVLKLSGFSVNRKLSRDISEMQIPVEMAEIFYGNDDDPVLRKGLIDVATGKMIPKEAQTTWREERDAIAATYNMHPRWAWQKEFLSYMNQLDPRVFAIEDANLANARRYIETSVELSDNAKLMLSTALDDVEIFPRPVYTWVENTPRIFPSAFGQEHGYSLLNLTADLRRILLPTLTEVDLKNAQLACFTKIAPVLSPLTLCIPALLTRPGHPA